MDIFRCEPSVDELLSDPMMPLLFDHARTSADDVRSLMRDVAARMVMTREGGDRVPMDGDRLPEPANDA